MNKKKKNSTAPFVNIGASSLLVIFLILCLITFAILTLTSARSDYTFSQKLADRKSDYYKANTKAEMWLDQIDTIFDEAYQEAASSDSTFDTRSYQSYIQSHLNQLSKEQSIPFSIHFASENSTIAYYVAINEKQNLCITLTFSTSPDKGDTYYTISQWQILSSKEWNGDQTLDLKK